MKEYCLLANVRYALHNIWKATLRYNSLMMNM